jgi:aquaporin related protein
LIYLTDESRTNPTNASPFFVQTKMHTNAKSPPKFFEGIKGDLWGASLEFIGTFFFLTLAFGGVQSASASTFPDASTDFILYASLAFGFSLLVSAWLFFRVTGGLFNPNVSLALLLVGIIGPTRFVMYSLAQLVGSIAAAAVVLALTPGPCSFKWVLFVQVL